MARDKDKDKVQEDDMLTTRNGPEDEAPDVEPDAPEPISEEVIDEDLGDVEHLVEQLRVMIARLEERVVKLEKKKKAEDIGYLVNPVKVIAGLALSAEQLSTFEQTFPYLF